MEYLPVSLPVPEEELPLSVWPLATARLAGPARQAVDLQTEKRALPTVQEATSWVAGGTIAQSHGCPPANRAASCSAAAEQWACPDAAAAPPRGGCHLASLAAAPIEPGMCGVPEVFWRVPR